MNALGLSAAECGPASAVGPLFRVARGTLLLLLAIIYAGSLDFFLLLSPVLLYGTYLVIMGCLFICFFYEWSVTRNLWSVAPYLIWLFGYFLWGMIVLSSVPIAASEGTKSFIKNVLLIGALAVALDHRTLRPFARLIVLAMLANFALCLWEAATPGLNERIARIRDPDATAYDVLRPAGLWCNPDEAAFAFLFGLLMARWVGRPLAVIARLAAVVGIFLTVSRTGAYLLAVCGLGYAGHWLRTQRLDSTKLAIACAGCLFAGTGAVALALHFEYHPGDHWQLARFLDFSETSASASGGSRIDIARTAAQKALDGPWYGWGLFTFQLHAQPDIPAVLKPPAHNIYLTVWGETGAPLAITYLLVLGLGAARVLRTPMLASDRLAVGLMWFCYLVIGLTWHIQFTAFLGIIMVGLIWRLPDVLRRSDEMQWKPRAV